MSTTSSQRQTGHREYSGGAVAATATAGILMMMVGAMHLIQGLIALVNDEFYVVGKEYVFQFDLTSWGWIHLVAGVVVGLAGIALFQGAVWARTVAVIVACLSILANFMWLPYYPLWSLTVIAFGVLVIWAVTAHGRDITQP
jgi:hypothetical protein